MKGHAHLPRSVSSEGMNGDGMTIAGCYFTSCPLWDSFECPKKRQLLHIDAAGGTNSWLFAFNPPLLTIYPCLNPCLTCLWLVAGAKTKPQNIVSFLLVWLLAVGVFTFSLTRLTCCWPAVERNLIEFYFSFSSGIRVTPLFPPVPLFYHLFLQTVCFLISWQQFQYFRRDLHPSHLLFLQRFQLLIQSKLCI